MQREARCGNGNVWTEAVVLHVHNACGRGPPCIAMIGHRLSMPWGCSDRHARRHTPSKAVHVQSTGFGSYVTPCGMQHPFAFVVDLRLQTCPSLAWRLYRRPQHPHGMLGEGKPPPCKEVRVHTLVTCKSTVSPRTLPVWHAASFCIHGGFALANEPLACMAAAPVATAPPRHARRRATTTMLGHARPQKPCTCNQQL